MSIQQPGQLPGGAPLAQGEVPLVGDQFMLSTLAFYLHTNLVLTSRRLYAIRPSVLLGLIAVGRTQSSFPIENVAGVNAGTRFDLLGVIFGILAILFGGVWVQVPGIEIFGGLLIVLGATVIVGAPKQAVEVMNSGGGVIRFPVSLFDRSRTMDFANRVSEAVARTSRGAQTSLQPMPAAVDAQGGPSEALGSWRICAVRA